LVILGTIYGIIPVVKTILHLYQEVGNITKSNKILSNKATLLENLSEDAYKQELNDLIAAVPNDKSIPTILNTIDAVANESRVEITSFSLSNVGSIASTSASVKSSKGKSSGSTLLSLMVGIRGSYENIYSFLAKINNVRRFFSIRMFNIFFPDTNTIDVLIGMDAFYAPLSPLSDTTNLPLEQLSTKEEDLLITIAQMPDYSHITQGAQRVIPSENEMRTNPFSL